MKIMQMHQTFFCLLLCSFLLFFPIVESVQAKASLNTYVNKYKNVEISQKSVDKLAEYNDLITYFCSFYFFRPRYKVSPDFLKALILAESGTDPHALSNKNARGLTQILPETGRLAAKELFDRQTDFEHISRSRLKNLQPDDLYDPAINILLACYLIAKYNYRYNGELKLVVSAWNAGANSINNNEPPDYRETLNLIGKINGYLIYLLNQKKQIGPQMATKE